MVLKAVNIIFLITLLFLSVFVSNATTNEELVWKVSVGDSKTYTWTTIYDSTNNNTDELVYGCEQIGCQLPGNLSIKEKDTFEVSLTGLSSTVSKTITYTDNFTSNWFPGIITYGDFVRKTTTNKTYWKEYAKYSKVDHVDQFASITLDGNIVTENWKFGLTLISSEIFIEDYIIKFDWKTGWRTEATKRIYTRPNASTWETGNLTYEVAFSSSSDTVPIPVDFYFFFGLIICSVYYRFRRKQR